MAGRSAAKRTTPRRSSGSQREGRASQVKPNNTTTATATKEDTSSATSSGSGQWGQFMDFMKQVQKEWRRVDWPTNKQLVGATKVVLWTLLVFSAYLGFLDWILIKIFHWGPRR